MKIVHMNTIMSPVVEDFLDQLRELNLVKYATEAAREMDFSSAEELESAIKRAMEICIQTGSKVEGNFKRIYLCSDGGITYDWKLSLLAYRLVCLNGFPTNDNVARMHVGLVHQMG